MIPIDDEEEKLIDDIDKQTLKFSRGNRTFTVSANDIYCYGETDFNDENILNQIENFNFLSHLGEVGVHICSNYNYKNHSCSSTKNYPLWTETWSSAKLAKLAHGYLGKPKRILLFKQFIKK